jgi:WD40 repeat protein
LREKLLGFRPPKELLESESPARRVDLERRLSYYLDTSFQVANDDFWTGNIEPALKESEYLIVISSPSALLDRPDGSENWVAREIDTFLKIHGDAEGRKRVIVVLASGASEEIFPGRLNALSDKWDWADLRDVSRFAALRPGAAERLGDALMKIVARIHEVPQEKLPILRQEEARKRGRLRLAVGAVALLIVAGLSAALGWAVVERDRAQVAERVAVERRDEALRSQSRLLAQASALALQRGEYIEAMTLALEGLPRGPADHERPSVAEAERALHAVVVASIRELQRVEAGGSRRLRVLPGGLIVAYEPPRVRPLADAPPPLSAQLIDGVSGRELGEIDDPGGLTSAMILSGDGKLLLADSHDQKARLWDLRTRTVRAVFPHDVARVVTVALSRDGTLIVIAARNGPVQLWRVGNDAPLTIGQCRNDTPSVAISPDNEHVAIGCFGSVRVWSVTQARELFERKFAGYAMLEAPKLVFARGRLFTNVIGETVVRVWTLPDGAQERLLGGHAVDITSLGASRDGARIVTTSSDGTARLSPAEGDAAAVVLRGHEGGVVAAQLSEDGQTILTGSADGTARLWSAATGRQLGVMGGHRDTVRDLALSADGAIALTGLANASLTRRWSLRNEQTVVLPSEASRPTGGVGVFVVSRDGTRIAANMANGRTHVWRASDGGSVTDLQERATFHSLTFLSANGSRLLTASMRPPDLINVGVWNVEGGMRQFNVDVRDSYRMLRPPVPSADGSRLATIEGDALVVRESAKGERLKSLRLPFDGYLLDSFGFSDDDASVFAHTNEGGTAVIWEAASGSERGTIRYGRGWRTATLSPDARHVLAVLRDGTARLLSVKDGAEVKVLPHPKVYDVRFSRDGQRIVTVSDDGSVRLWSLMGHKPDVVIEQQAIGDVAAVFSPDGTRLLTLVGGVARLWDSKSGALMATITTGGVTKASFTAAGVVTVSSDDLVRLWRLYNAQQLVDIACTIMPRPLGRAERRAISLDEDPKDPPCGWHPDMKEKPAYRPKAPGR